MPLGAGILADVNLWLATVLERHPHHVAAVDWWRRQVLPNGARVHFCRITQLGLLRLLTNAQVMGSSRRTPAQAWEDYGRLLIQPPVGFLTEPRGLDPLFKQLSEGRGPSPALWTDAYLAAFAIAADLRFASFDRGFRRFRGLRLTTLA